MRYADCHPHREYVARGLCCSCYSMMNRRPREERARAERAARRAEYIAAGIYGPRVQERFWAKVNKTDGCWLWTGTTVRGGYGSIRFMGRGSTAHRYSFTLANGPIPDGLWVLHRCDNPPCVNPAHLFLGTAFDNNQDMIQKGRFPAALRSREHSLVMRSGIRNRARGERSGKAKLTEEKVNQIRALRADGWTQQRIADEVGVTQTCVSLVLRGKTWAHI